jgi:hypothetical protein
VPPPSDSPLPDSPLPESPLPDSPLPDGPLPDTPRPEDQPPPLPGDPAPGAPQPQTSEEGIDLPRLFVLRTLPSGMEETSTTVRQTTRDDEVVLEQVTLLDATSQTGGVGEVTVRATRAEDAAARLDALVEAGDEELSVRGLPAHLVADAHLVWLVPGEVETLLEIIAPDGVRTDQLLTIGNGLEVVR